jgi:uncharacterized protein HemX
MKENDVEALSIASLVVAVIAAGVAIWQGVTSQRSLDAARLTEERTDRALEEIRRLSQENQAIVSEIKSEIDTRITRILDLKLDNERKSADMSSQFSAELIKGMFGGMFGGQPGQDPQAK